MRGIHTNQGHPLDKLRPRASAAALSFTIPRPHHHPLASCRSAGSLVPQDQIHPASHTSFKPRLPHQSFRATSSFSSSGSLPRLAVVGVTYPVDWCCQSAAPLHDCLYHIIYRHHTTLLSCTMVLPRGTVPEADPHHAIRRFWAQHCIWASQDQRDWPGMAPDIMRMVLGYLDSKSVAAVRGTCRAWWSAANTAVQALEVRSWPADANMLHHFTSLTALSIRGSYIEDDALRLAMLGPLLLMLSRLPALKRLELSHPGPGSLENLDVLTGLTSLYLSRAQPQHSMLSMGGMRLPDLLQQEDAVAAELEDLQFRAAAQAAGPPEDQPGADQVDQDAEPVLPLPPVAAAGQQLFGLGGGGAAPHPFAAAASDEEGAGASAPSRGSSSSSRGGQSRVHDVPMLPAALSNMSTLRELRLDNLVPTYSVLAPLGQLEALELRGQTLRPRSGLLVACSPLAGVGVLTGLTRLVARCNYGINRLPAELGGLTRLKHLDVSKNMLWSLPPELMQLSDLQYLDLSSNCLSALPEDMYLLARLTRLDISNNSRVTLPSTLARMGALQELTLNWVWTDLTPLWEGSTGLSRLEVLSVIGNGVASLPPAVGGFKKLRSLSLSMNNLTTLPAQIGSLTTLTTLEISDNRLASLPPSMGRLGALSSLSLRSNALGELPEEMGQLTGLTYLDVSMNHLAVLPNSLSQLTALQQLALSMNPLTSLPEGLEALQQLKILEMYYVSLTAEDVLQLSAGGESTPAAGGSVDGDADAAADDASAAGVGGAAAAAATEDLAAWSRGPLRKLQARIPGLYVFSNTYLSGSDTDTEGGHGAESPAAALESLLRLHGPAVALSASGSGEMAAAAAGGTVVTPGGSIDAETPDYGSAWGSGDDEELPLPPAAAAGQAAAREHITPSMGLLVEVPVTLLDGDTVVTPGDTSSVRDAASDASPPRSPVVGSKGKGRPQRQVSARSSFSIYSPGGASSSSWEASSSSSDAASSSQAGARDQVPRGGVAWRHSSRQQPAGSSSSSSSSRGTSPAERQESLPASGTSGGAHGAEGDVSLAEMLQLARSRQQVAMGTVGAAAAAGAESNRPVRRWTRYDDECDRNSGA